MARFSVKPGLVVAVVGGLVLAVVAVVMLAVVPLDGGLGGYERAAKARWMEARAKPAPAHAFRATVCAPACVLVEAGGLAFVVGAGEGAAEGLASRGLLRRDLDGVLLMDLRFASTRGLAALGEAVLAAGRTDPLTVYGPEGSLTVVDGANLMLSGSGNARVRLAVGVEGEDQGLSGEVVYDSGVVTIVAFETSGDAKARVYRVDVPGRSLILAGCSAQAEDVVAAARGARQAAAVIGAGSVKLQEIERNAAMEAGLPQPPVTGCMSMEEAFKAGTDARLSAVMVLPLAPEPESADSLGVWSASATIPKGAVMAIAGPGAMLDLTGEEPTIRQAN